MPLNNIPRIQNEEAQQRLLWARRELYARGKLLLSVQLVLTLAVPVIGSIAAAFIPELKGTVALLSLLIAVLDPTVIDRWHIAIRKASAQLQEQFDTTVLGLEWDRFIAGAQIEKERVHALAKNFSPQQPDPKLTNWYPPAVGEAPLHAARIVCQRSNLWYDGTLRRTYGNWVLGVSIGLTVTLFVIASISGLTVDSFVLSVLAPASPILIWGVREHFRQRDSADRLERLLQDADALWDRVRGGSCREEECTFRSRQFQNAIFDHRTSSPLTFSWIYNLLRSDLETRMNRSAEEMVRELSSKAVDY